MTIKQTLADIQALPNVTATYISETGEFRVTLTFVGQGLSLRARQERQEAVACYTNDADDALGTARAMSEQAEAEANARLGL